MTGMKEGAGEDPFAEDTSQSSEDSSSTSPDPDPKIEGGSEAPPTDSADQTMSIPYKFRRDSVKDGRTRVPLFLQSETKTAEREAMRTLEDRFDDNVSMTDLREALVKVGLENLDATEGVLEELGYGWEFD